MSLKHGLLGLIKYEGKATGYELDKIFKDSLANFWTAKTSQIYRELGTMEDLGWLTSERIIQEDKPNKRQYTITEEGKAEFQRWLTTPKANLGGVKSEFLMRIFFSADVPKKDTIGILEKIKEDCLNLMEKHIEIKKMIDSFEKDEHSVYWQITLLQGEIFTKSSLEWATQAIEILKAEEAK